MNDATLRTTLPPDLQDWVKGRLLAKFRDDARPPTAGDKRPAVSAADFAQDIVRTWNTDDGVRAEFPSLECYAAFRTGIADGTIKGYDADGEKLMRTDPVSLAIRQAAEEDRAVGADPRAPLDDRVRLVWSLHPGVRAEFGDSFERYAAWRKRVERSRG